MQDRQLSHFVVEALVALADHGEVSVTELLEGLPIEEHELRRRMGGISWEHAVEFITRLEARLGPERLREYGARVPEISPIARSILRRLIRPRQMLRFVFRVLGPSMYPMYEINHEERDLPEGGVEVHVSLRLKEGFGDCKTLFDLHGISTASVPTLIQEPALPCRTETTGRSGDYWFIVR